jgi:solute carrier family 13 (sodium-dependent dicarboxylate transporter), member 2/3/5
MKMLLHCIYQFALSTGLIQQTDMVKAGLTVGVLSMIIGYTVLITFCRLNVL